ncbi:MAG: hypothetical protein MJ014_00120 [Methanocorpusculum sp.]|nr:hypothetical protein [Methanocorpusculum sp.]
MTLEINDTYIPVENISKLEIYRDYNIEEKVFGGSPGAMHLPVYYVVNGSLSVSPTNGVWLEIGNWQEETGFFPWVNFQVTVPPGSSIFPNRSQSAGGVKDFGHYSVTLENIVFSKLPVVVMSATENAPDVDITFTADVCRVTNMLAGSNVFGVAKVIKEKQNASQVNVP